jgi:hypothetical protein
MLKGFRRRLFEIKSELGTESVEVENGATEFSELFFRPLLFKLSRDYMNSAPNTV